MPSAALPVGPEFAIGQANASISAPRIAMASGGRFAVAWNGTDGSGNDVFARLFDADGTPLTGDLLVNTTTAGDQYTPDIAMDDAGDFVVVWTGPDGYANGVFAQRFDAAGQKVGGERRANDNFLNEQRDPAVAVAPDGRFVVSWNDLRVGPYWQLYARRFDADGTPLDAAAWRVDAATDGAVGSRAAASEDGFVFAYDAWTDGYGSSTVSFVHDYGWDGTERGPNTLLSNRYGYPWSGLVAVSMNPADGSFVTTFNQLDGDGWGYYAQRFDAAGNAVGANVQVNTATTNNQIGNSVAVFPDGSFVVVWFSEGEDGSGKGVYGRRFDISNNPLGDAFRVNTYTTGDQTAPQAAADAYGGFVGVWESYGQDGNSSGIYAQQYAVEPISLDAVIAPSQVRQGETVNLSAVVSNTDDCPVLYAWDFGDSTAASGTNLSSPTHSYASTGLKLVRLTVTDHYGNQDSAIASVLVRTPQSLIVTAGDDVAAVVGTPVAFAGTMSFPGGSISSDEIAWDMDYSDGAFTPTVTGTLTPTFTFTSSGTRTVALRVMDAETGAYALSTLMVQADCQGPTVTVGSDQTVTVGQYFTVAGSYTDSDGTVNSADIAWDFDWTGEFTPDAIGALSPTWHYDSPGTYTVMLQVTDSHGVADLASFTVTVSYAAPFVHVSGPDTATAQGDTVSLDVGYWFANGASPLAIDWDFDYDGSTFTPESAWSGKAAATAQYAAPGTYTAAVRVTDPNNVVYLRTAPVTVVGTRPVVTVPDSLTTTQGQSLTLSATVSSPDPVTVAWDFDYDGINYEPDASVNGQLSPSHTYLAAGRNYAAVRATNGSEARTSIRTIFVDVADVAPTASVSYSGPTPEGSPVYFTINNFSDVNPDAEFGFLVDWTGTGEDLVRLPDDEYTTNYDGSTTFRHVFADDSGASTFPVTVRILDNEGAFRNYTLGVVVTNVAPTANLIVGGINGDLTVGTGVPLYLSASDPSHRDWSAGFTYYYSINGGSYTATTATKFYLPSYAPGYYQVNVYALDKDGGVGPVETVPVTVVDTFGRVQNGSFHGGGSILVSWSGGSAVLAPGQNYDFGGYVPDLHVTLLTSNAAYRIFTNMGIASVDYAAGVTGVNLYVTTDGAADTYWLGDGDIGAIDLPPGTDAGHQSVLTAGARGDLGGITVAGGSWQTWAYADSIAVLNQTGTISGLDRITNLFAAGWVNNISANEGIGYLTAFAGIKGTVTTTSDDREATIGLTASVGPGGVLGELRTARLDGLTAGGDINKLTVGQLNGPIQFTVAGDINALYLGDATGSGQITGTDGQIKEAVYDQKAAQQPPQIDYMPFGLALIIAQQKSGFADPFWKTVEGGDPSTTANGWQCIIPNSKHYEQGT